MSAHTPRVILALLSVDATTKGKIMKKLFRWPAVVALGLFASILRAETPPAAAPGVTVSSATRSAVQISTPSVAIVGETVSLPPPQPMTERAGAGVFVTLTRTALSSKDLPTTAEI